MLDMMISRAGDELFRRGILLKGKEALDQFTHIIMFFYLITPSIFTRDATKNFKSTFH